MRPPQDELPSRKDMWQGQELREDIDKRHLIDAAMRGRRRSVPVALPLLPEVIRIDRRGPPKTWEQRHA